MQALVYTAPNTLEVTDAPLPVPGPGDLLVRVHAVGICGSDMHAYHGHDSRRPAPLILGHEAAGIIAEGPRAGERVTINPLVVDPDCPAARAGRPHLSPTRQIISMPPRPGAFAGFVTIPARNVLPVPDAFDLQRAALAEPLAVGWHAVRIGLERLDQPLRDVTALVLGGGAIGLAAALVLRRAGVRALHVAEPHPERRALIAGQGGMSAYDPREGDGIDAPDLVIDAVGTEATRAAASRLVRPGGVIVHVGLLPGESGFDIRRITLQEITLMGSYCYTPGDFADTLAAMVAGELGPLDWFETRPLAEGPAAFADLDAGRVAAAKIVLLPDGA
ncbi:alcohol dehydrogenase catalytic domain-containing protein [Halovulum dunhuangense]|uniref:Alcohol dehydrogenase catalytic domain-containing protein n=1 Tax=Halovulum dunhuangense TaxID=1505036 RepID=A0A849L6P6_9RHOB|nr:alcohol dehydrogenase catalytic domain-containing protein [Halovulum dunhuangense]NNU81814.1 alcohol dehydrogenase catalytic domain-containing protein [Halovulum dunhuangense]